MKTANRKKSSKSTAPKARTTPAKSKKIEKGIRYKKDYLEQVIARIDFASSVNFSEKGPAKEIVDSIKSEFPIPEHVITSKPGITIVDGKTRPAMFEGDEWIYFNRDRDCSIKMSDDCMLLEYKKYKSFDHLCTHFLSLSNTLFDKIDNLQVKRLGLRYVDKIELPDEKDPTNWEKYIDKRLLSIIDIADDRQTLSRVFHVLDFNYGDWNVRFQCGMTNPDHPSPIRKKIFVLDTDVHCNLLLGKDDIKQWIEKFHEKAILCFEEVITNELRKKMGVKNG